MSLGLWEIWDRHHCEGSTALCEQLSMLSRPCSTTRWWQSLEDSDPLFKWSICQSYCWVDNSRQSGRILFFILVNIAYSCLDYQCDWTSKTLSDFLMLREDLKGSDIPHRTVLTEHIMKMFNVHLAILQDDMKVSHHTLVHQTVHNLAIV